MTPTHKPKIGLALGGGSARGWAHIGVIRTLAEAGIVPDIVCGTSIGALVGAAYVDGDLDRLEQWSNPPWFFTIAYTMAKPSPVPLPPDLVVKKGS